MRGQLVPRACRLLDWCREVDRPGESPTGLRCSSTSSSAPPCTVERICAGVHCALAPKVATWTPHSYSAPQRAQVRKIISSRLRSEMLPRSSKAPAMKRCSDARIARHRAEQEQRRRAAHQLVEVSLDLRRIRRLDRAIRGSETVDMPLYKSYITFVYGQDQGAKVTTFSAHARDLEMLEVVARYHTASTRAPRYHDRRAIVRRGVSGACSRRHRQGRPDRGARKWQGATDEAARSPYSLSCRPVPPRSSLILSRRAGSGEASKIAVRDGDVPRRVDVQNCFVPGGSLRCQGRRRDRAC